MATIPAITIPDPDLADVLEGVECVWRKDAEVLVPGYEARTDRQKLRVCTMAFYRVHAKNLRQERAERSISVQDVTPQ